MKRVVAIILAGGLLAGLIAYRQHQRGEGTPAAKEPAAGPIAVRKASSEGEITANPTEPPAERSLRLQREIADTLRRDGDGARNRVANDLLPALIAIDAASAGRLGQSWESGAQRAWLLREVARLWSAADCAAAIKWVAGLENRHDQQITGETVVAQIAQLDPAGALTAAQLFQVGVDDGSQEHIAQIWTEASPVEAVDWITNRPASAQRDRLISRMAYVRAQSDPVEAANLVSKFISAGAVRDEAILSVSRQWAERDPNAATLWVQQLPAGPLRSGCLAAIANVRKNR
jgi:hypothetical protein